MLTAVISTTARLAPPLRRLYLARFGFAIAWAALMVVVGREFGPAAAVLVVLYPLFDAAAAVSTPARRDRTRRTGSFA